LRPFDDRQFQFFEQDLLQLFRAVNVELAARNRVDLNDETIETIGQVDALPLQLVDVDANAVVLHVDENEDQRPFQRPVKIPQLFFAETSANQLDQLPRHVGIFGSI